MQTHTCQVGHQVVPERHRITGTLHDRRKHSHFAGNTRQVEQRCRVPAATELISPGEQQVGTDGKIEGIVMKRKLRQGFADRYLPR